MIKKLAPKPQSGADIEYYDSGSTQTESQNTIGDVYQAIKRAIKTVREDEEDLDSPQLFKTIAVDTGQFERIMSNNNTEYETAFPACFVRFTNVHFLVAQQRIGEGRATIRIRFILNRLDNQHVDWETYPFYIAERLNQAIQAAKDTEETLQERCNLMYFDMPQSTNMLQAYWLDYEIYFRITSSYKYTNWIKKKVITPPFTNNSDTDNEKPDVNTPTYNEVSSLEIGNINPNNIINNPIDVDIRDNNKSETRATIYPSNKYAIVETDNQDTSIKRTKGSDVHEVIHINQ